MAAAACSETRQVARIWHPAPRGAIILAKNGSGIEVLQGAPAYQLSTGEIIEV